jgi:aspartate/methionine/tyrosine aminotransferase
MMQFDRPVAVGNRTTNDMDQVLEKRDDAVRVDTAVLYGLMAQSKTYSDRIELGRGDPDLDTPSHIVVAVRRALREHPVGHHPVEGILPLRQAIARRLEDVNGIQVDPESEIVVTNGGQEAVFIMVQTVLGPGDEILVPDPNYNTYRDAVRFARAKRVSVPTFVERSFRVEPERMRAAISERTRAMLLASPNNPSGAVIDPQDVQALAEIARAHDLIILADDIYDRFLYDGAQHQSPAALPGIKERTLTLNAVSKQYSMCGWRLGWIAGPADLMERVRDIKAAVTGGTSHVAQLGALAALSRPDDCIVEAQQTYARRRRIVMDGLESLGLAYGVPQGGQFVFVDISSTNMRSIDFVRWLLEACHVLVYPGGAFGAAFDNFIRITFLQPEDLLAEAFERMGRLMEEL